MKSYRLIQNLQNAAVYVVLTVFALFMLFPFAYMITTSLKEPADTFRYPPRLLPRAPLATTVTGYEGELPLYYLDVNGEQREYALVESGIRVGPYAPVDDLEAVITRPQTGATPTGTTATVNGEELELFTLELDGQIVEVVLLEQTALGRVVDPADPSQETLANVRLSQPVESLTTHPENYTRVGRIRRSFRHGAACVVRPRAAGPATGCHHLQ